MGPRIAALALLGCAGACGKVEHVTPDAAVDDPQIDAPMADAAIDAMPFVCKQPVAAGGTPDDTTRPVWAVATGVSGSNDTGSSPGVFLVGDKVLADVDPQMLANNIRFFGGTNAVVVAAGGAGVAHFNKAGLIQPANLSTLPQYEAFFGTIRVTLLALGGDDARLITRERGQTGGYTADEFVHQLDLAISAALAHSRCVVVVNVADHWNLAASDIVAQVDGAMRCAATANARVHIADWKTFSATHPEWFLSPTDIRHSDAGKTAYRDFVSNAIGVVMNNGGC